MEDTPRGSDSNYDRDESAYWIGVDIGGTKILLFITNHDGKIVYEKVMPTSPDVQSIIQMIQVCIQQSGIPEKLICGMGVGVPGIVDSNRGVVIEAPSVGWNNVPLSEEMSLKFPFPVFINNDVNCAGLGELWMGGGKGVENLFFIAIGTGLGSAIILNGELFEGHSFAAGEIGYFVDMNDLRNNWVHNSGSFGALERYVSGSALSASNIPSKQIFAESKKGNEIALTIVENFIIHLSVALSNVISTLNPQKIVIGGGVSESLSIIMDDIVTQIEQICRFPVSIELSSLGNRAGCYGAIAYASHKSRVLLEVT